MPHITDLRRGQIIGDASRRWVHSNAVSYSYAGATYAPIASPTFTGDPKAPTPAPGDNDTSLATTAFVKSQNYVTGGPYLALSGGTLSGALTVNSTITTTGNIQSNASFTAAGANAIFNFQQRDNTSITWGWYATGGIGRLWNSSVGNDLVTVSSNGSLTNLGSITAGVGYIARSGTGGATQPNNWNIDWTGPAHLWIDNVNQGAISVSSDYRIKDNIADLPPMWDRVKALRPISYTIKGNDELLVKADPAERWSFIAHELQETLLDTAATGYKDAPNLVQSPNIMTLLAAVTKALQEAMARIESLESR